MKEIKITKDNYSEVVINSEKPVLVDFWATWCGPCSMLSPVVAEIAEDMDDKLIVGKINVDEEFELAQAFKVMSIPTLILFKNGKPVSQSIGYQGKAALVKWIGENI